MELLSKLQESGLTKREAQIYLALLQKKEFVASEIASITPVGRTKVYEIIPSLISKGLCNEVHKNGKRIYQAVEPEIALQNLLSFFQSEYEQQLNKKRNLINELKNNLEEIHANNINKSDALDYVEIIRDINQIKKRWVELQKNAKFEMLGFSKAPYSLNPKQNVKNQEEMLKKNKVTGRCIYEHGDISTKQSHDNFITFVELCTELGEEARIVEELPMKLAVIDEKITMLALNDPVSMKPSITTMIVTHPNYAKAHKSMFESYWEKAIPFDEFKKNKTNP